MSMPLEADTGPSLPQPSVRSRAESSDLGVLWTAATTVGILAITFIPIPPTSPRPWLRMVAPVLAMVFYLALAWGRAKHSRQRVADSLYFMGFLWTLWALIDALLSQGAPTSSVIYTAFGYALIGTFSGMAGRLLLMQFSRDLESQESEAADRIDDRVAELDEALGAAVGKVSAFGDSLEPAGARLQVELKSAANAWASEAKNSVTAVTAATKLGIREGTENLAAALMALGQQSALIGTQLETVNLELRDPAADFVKTVKGMSSKTKLQADALADALNQLANALREPTADQKLTSALSNLVSALSHAEVTVNGTASSVQGAGHRLTETATRASAVVVDAAKAMRSSQDVVAAGAGAAVASTAELSKASASVRADAEEVDRILRDLVDFVDRQVAK